MTISAKKTFLISILALFIGVAAYAISIEPAPTQTITRITCSNGLVCNTTDDGYIFLSKITGSGGVTSNITIDENINVTITGSGGIIVTQT